MSLARYLGGVGALGALVYIGINLKGDMTTPGMKNIEDRWSSGGGAKTHTPGGGTPRGHPDLVEGVQENPNQGVGTPGFEKNEGNQKGEPNSIGKAWNKSQYGSEKGKTGGGNS